MMSAGEIALPNWPALLSTELAARYLSLDEGSFAQVTARFGLRPVDLGLSVVRWRRADLDRLVGRLPAAEVQSVDRTDREDELVERIVQGVSGRIGRQLEGPVAHTMSLKDAARFLSIGRSTVHKLIAEGALPTSKVGSRTLIKRSDLEALLVRPKSTPKRGPPSRVEVDLRRGEPKNSR